MFSNATHVTAGTLVVTGTCASSTSVAGDGSGLTGLDVGAFVPNLRVRIPRISPTPSVPTVAALQGFAASDGQLVDVQGYYAIGDGGQGLFLYSASSTAPDDGGITISPSSNRGRFVRTDGVRGVRGVRGGAVRARWFGFYADYAHPVQQSANIQRAATAAAGTTLVFDEGTYYLGAPLVLSGTTTAHVRGSGLATTVLNMLATPTGISIQCSSNVVVENISINAYNNNNAGLTGVLVAGPLSSSTFSKMGFGGQQYGMYFSGPVQRTTFDQLYFYYVSTACIYAADSVGSGTRFTTCFFNSKEGMPGYYTYGIRAQGQASGCLVRNSFFFNDKGIRLDGGATDGVLQSNQFECTDEPIFCSAPGSKNLQLSNNSYRAGRAPFLPFAQTSMSSDNVTPHVARSLYRQRVTGPTELFRLVSSDGASLYGVAAGTCAMWGTVDGVAAPVCATYAYAIDRSSAAAPSVTLLRETNGASAYYTLGITLLKTVRIGTVPQNVWSVTLLGKAAATLSCRLDATTYDTQVFTTPQFAPLDLAMAPPTFSSRAEARAWMRTAGFGVWSDNVVANLETFNVDRFASQVAATGASFAVYQCGQTNGFYSAPNAVYARLVGPTLAALLLPTRDLIRDLGVALHQRGLRLFVYLAPEGPLRNPEAVTALGGIASSSSVTTTELYLTNWEAVITCWSMQWGTLVDGWWLDGSYTTPAHNYDTCAAAVRAGNPVALVTFNGFDGFDGVGKFTSFTPQQDYTAGETNTYLSISTAVGLGSAGGQGALGPYLNPGEPVEFLGWTPQTHTGIPPGQDQVWNLTTYLGIWWGNSQPFPAPNTAVATWAANVSALGGTVMLDAGVYSTGDICPSHFNTLRAIGVQLGRTSSPPAVDPLDFRFPGGTTFTGVPFVPSDNFDGRGLIMGGTQLVGGTPTATHMASMLDARNMATADVTCKAYCYQYSTGMLYTYKTQAGLSRVVNQEYESCFQT